MARYNFSPSVDRPGQFSFPKGVQAARNKLAELDHWGRTRIHEAIQAVAEDYDINLGKLGQPIRVAVTSGPVSPPIDVTLWLVGKERTIKRLDHALGLIEARAAANSG